LLTLGLDEMPDLRKVEKRVEKVIFAGR
jgi:hypothetical protein